MLPIPVARSYGSGDEDDDEYEALGDIDTNATRFSMSYEKFMRPVLGGVMVPSRSRSRARSRASSAAAAPPMPPPARDRERDRELDGDMPLAPAPAAPMPPETVLHESEQSRRVTELLGEGGGIPACFSCRYARGSLMPPAARNGIEMMHALLRSAPAGSCRTALALEMAHTFEQHVRTPMNRYRHEHEDECPTWHPRDIYDHFFTPYHGRLDAVTSQESRALMFETMLARMDQYYAYERCTTSTGATCMVPRPDVVSNMIRISDQLTKLYQQRQSAFSLAASEAPATATAPGIADSRRALIGPAPRRHA